MDRLIDLVLSDLHLGQAPCPISRNFLALLDSVQGQVAHLVIAGDLFEAWLGDDLANAFEHQIAAAIAAVGADQTSFLPGNRDFLIADDWARRADLTIRDQVDLTVSTCPTLITHGDELCLDDEAYQAWRRTCRNPEWQSAFKAQSADQRVAFAAQARAQSQARGGQQESVIADVAQRALGPGNRIHGHTHRPAIHRNGATRVVIGDWRPQAWVFVNDERPHLGLWDHGWQARIDL
ncbi:UDP-2,3-diacylglucosamine diphosphatase [Litorivicinus lipolyticus]|uniref:UDP-2,3-diacylglucosamine diphosphatase n=1 Tax=Litorivicinus lipolyticus TaxID=418701 RepID=UPI003B5BB26F